MKSQVMRKTLALAILSCLALLPAQAQQLPMQVQAQGLYFFNVAGSVLTRPNDTTAYAANETVCAAKSVTACVPGTFAIPPASFAGQSSIVPAGYPGQSIPTRMTLLKSGSTTTNANFTIWLYAAAPTLTTPTQFDSTAYTGPRAADLPNYIGNAVCGTPVATSDTSAQVWYECTLSNPNTAGALIARWLQGTSVNYVITVTAAYTPVANETLQPFVSGMY